MGEFLTTLLTSPMFWVGALSTAVPVVIHMVYRRRAPRIRFSTLRFLRAATERTARRRRIRDWLLLLLRAAAIFFLVLALTAPPLRSAALGGGGEKAEVAAVFVLDNSYSMAADWENASQYARARDAAGTLLRSLSDQSQAAVIHAWPTPANGPRCDLLTTDHNSLDDAISRSEVSAVAGDLAAAIVRAEELLEKAAGGQREIYVFTDLQKAAWRPLPERIEGREATMIIINCGTGERENVAITKADVVVARPAVGVPLLLNVRVKNLGEHPKEGKAILYVDRQRYAERAIRVGPAAEVATAFSIVFNSPGPHAGWVDLDINDILRFDNRRYFALDVPQRLRVGVVRDKPGAMPFLDESYFILPALNPGIGPASPIAPEIMLRSELTRNPLRNYRVLYLLNLPQLSPPEARALTRYVEDGGALVIFPGDAVAPEAWNTLAASHAPAAALLPARLGNVLPEKSDTADPVTLDKVDFKHPVFEPFRRLAPAFFNAVVMKHYFDLQVDETSGARALAWLSDGRPFLVERAAGEGGGKVLLFCTSATTAWSNLPARRLYLPLLHQITYYLARMHGTAGNVLPGRPVRFPALSRTPDLPPSPPDPAKAETSAAAAKTKSDPKDSSTIEVTDPRGLLKAASLEVRADNARHAVFRDTARPGIYAWRRTGDDTEHGAFVVNIDTAESDLAVLTQEAVLRDMLAHRKAYFAADAKEAQALAVRLREGIQLRTPLLFLVLGVLVAECVLANQARARRPDPPVRVTGAGVSLS